MRGLRIGARVPVRQGAASALACPLPPRPSRHQRPIPFSVVLARTARMWGKMSLLDLHAPILPRESPVFVPRALRESGVGDVDRGGEEEDGLAGRAAGLLL